MCSPNLKKERFLFIDLDETMISTIYANSQKEAESIVYLDQSDMVEVVSFELEDGWYITYLRNGVKTFLRKCREIYGHDNVYILTAATKDYACKINELHELGFKKDHIISREDIKYKPPSDQGFKLPGQYVLVDNEEYWFHCYGRVQKVSYLHNLPQSRYIKVEDFIGRCVDENDRTQLWNDVLEDIEEAFNS